MSPFVILPLRTGSKTGNDNDVNTLTPTTETSTDLSINVTTRLPVVLSVDEYVINETTTTTAAEMIVATTTPSLLDVDRMSNVSSYFLSNVDANVITEVVVTSIGSVTSGGLYDDDVWSSSSPTASNENADNTGIPLPEVVIVGTLVSLAIIAIVIGNAFVVASVAVYREMRTLTNWMIVSLASADILVAVAVLPLSAYQVKN